MKHEPKFERPEYDRGYDDGFCDGVNDVAGGLIEAGERLAAYVKAFDLGDDEPWRAFAAALAEAKDRA